MNKFISGVYSTINKKIGGAKENISRGVDNAIKSKYRTLDFSSVGMFGLDGSNAADVELRRWHQMVMYLYTKDSSLATYNNEGKNEFIIASNLPTNFSYGLSSNYNQPLSSFSNIGTGITNMLAQGFGGSNVLQAGSIAVWSGSSPLNITVTIPVLDDGWEGDNQNGFSTNFMEALEVLSGFCLPSSPYGSMSDTGEKDNKIQRAVKAHALRAPPTPVSLDIKYGKKKDQQLNASGNFGYITVQFGGMLLVQQCILRSMTITYPNTKAMIKHQYSGSTYYSKVHGGGKKHFLTPIIAELTLNFFVPVAMTKDMYRDMLWSNSAAKTSNFSYDTSDWTGGTIASGIDTLKSWVK